MTAFFQKRIQKEIRILYDNAEKNNLKVLNIEDTSRILISIMGAEGTLYAGETFVLEFRLPNNYPIESPEVVFIDSIPVNEHVYSNGHICLSILYDNWSPALTLFAVCLSVLSMLSGAKEKKKPANDKRYCKVAVNKSPKSFKWVYDD